MAEEIKKQMDGLSDKEKNSILEREALNFIKNSPFQFLKLYTKKFINFWRFYPKTISQNKFTSQKNTIISLMFYGLVIPLAFIGMAASLKQWRNIFILYAAIFSFAIGYSFFGTTIRYRLPVEPYIIIFTAIGGLTIYNLIYLKLIVPIINRK